MAKSIIPVVISGWEKMKIPLFYKQKPTFGIDIGRGSIKMVQLLAINNTPTLIGYGFTSFDPSVMDDRGMITDVEAVAKAAKQLADEQLIGGLVSNSVVATVPSAFSYTRTLQLPKMEKKELDGAVRLEAEQYIPVAIDELYIDYEVEAATSDDSQSQDVFMVAIPNYIVDSYLEVFAALGLEVSAIEPSLSAIVRSVSQSLELKDTVMVIDLGSRSSDLSVYDGKTIRVTGTTKKGGEDITDTLIENLNITKRQAFHGKARYGINPDSKQGREILKHSQPILDDLILEIKKMQRYYQGRNNSNDKIGEIIILGGGANMPGLNEFIQKQTDLKVTSFDPWRHIDMGNLQAPNKLETTLFTNVIGNALVGKTSGAVKK